MSVHITFLGGTETVTGSKFLLQTDRARILVDCGLFQGYKWLRERNWQSLPVDIKSLDAILLTHAHLDHSGYIPVLYKHGYRGPVFTHHASKALCHILLADSGHIQEADAKYYRKHKLGKHAHPEPLYDQATAEASMELFQGIEYGEQLEVNGVHFNLQDAGHILGAASIVVEAEGHRIGFSGDLGRPDDLFMRPPTPLPELDLLLLESTYGNRRHEQSDPFAPLAEVVNKTVNRGGALLVPSFAVGRAQVMQYLLSLLMERGEIPQLPIYLDSPMAIDVSDLYCRYHQQHRLTAEECHRIASNVIYTRDVEESKALANQKYPHVIIAGSGMATGGRILHHFKRLLPNPDTTVLFTGYQAGGTRGAKMLEGAESVRIHGEWIPVRAHVENIEGLSGHADYLQIGDWLRQGKLRDRTPIQLVHGDPDALEGMREYLLKTTRYDVSVAGYRSILHL